MGLFHIIAATQDGHVYEYEIRAPDAPSAIVKATMHIRAADDQTLITNMHARHINGTR